MLFKYSIPVFSLFSSHSIGLISLVLVLSFWLIASILTKDILREYNKPALMTFISVTSMQVYFVFLKLKDPLFEYLKTQTREAETDELLDTKDVDIMDTINAITLTDTAMIASKLFLVYFIGLYFMNASVKFTTLGSSSILSATCSFFTLFLGISMKIETFSLIKGLAVLFTFVGVIVNSLPSVFRDSLSFGTQTWGNALALSGAICYAIFLVLLQKQTQKKIGLNRSLLFAFIGCFTMLTFWPVLIYLSISGNEVLELPPNRSIYIYLVLKTVLGSIIPSYLWNVAFALTSPLYMAVGTSLTIPQNFVADYFMGNSVGWSEAIGAVIVTFGCLLMNLTDLKQ